MEAYENLKVIARIARIARFAKISSNIQHIEASVAIKQDFVVMVYISYYSIQIQG